MDLAGTDRELVEDNFGLFSCTNDGHSATITLFDQSAQSSFCDPCGVGLIERPALQPIEHPCRMILRNVVEMICHGLPDVEARVVPEVLHNRYYRRRIGNQGIQVK